MMRYLEETILAQPSCSLVQVGRSRFSLTDRTTLEARTPRCTHRNAFVLVKQLEFEMFLTQLAQTWAKLDADFKCDQYKSGLMSI
jgi:hypothetical protein